MNSSKNISYDARYEFCENCKYAEIEFCPNHLICNHPNLKTVDGMLVDETSYCDACEGIESND